MKSLPAPVKKKLKAFLYRRKSNEEQSNWSVSGQSETLEIHTKRHDIEIIGDYEDDGFTASNFDRPGWKKMISDLKYKKPDVVLCTKYNRIVRRAGLGLSTVERLESKHQVIFIAVTEMPFVDPRSAVFHKFRGDLFVTADFEWRQGRDVSMGGTWSAHKQGRTWHAAWGWKNARDAGDDPIIVIDEDKRQIMENIGKNRYELMMPESEVARIAKLEGWDQKGKMAMNRILNNPRNFGLVPVPAYKDYPAELVRGIHEQLWPEEWYYKYVAVKPGPKATKRMQYNEDAPLRNFIVCKDCDKNLTAYSVIKKSGLVFWYYKCQTCAGNNFSAKEKDEQMNTVLKAYSFPAETVDRLKEMVEGQLKEKTRQAKTEKSKALTKIANLEQRLENIEEAHYGEGRMDAEKYAKWRNRYETDLHGLRIRVAEIERIDTDIDLNTIEVFKEWSDLSKPYQKMNAAKKHSLLELLFGKVVALKKGYLTERIPLLFDYNPLSLNELETTSIGGHANNRHVTPASTRNGANIELIVRLGEMLQTA